MRILHTADWHVGRRLGRHDRAAETAAALEEVAGIATEHQVDLVRVPALVGCLPFLREGRVVDFMRDAGEWYGQYAERIAALTAAFDAALVARAGTDLVPLLVAHFMVGGVKVGGSERELHVGGAYVASAQAIPPGPQYVALGHIHAPQAIPGSPVPGQYAG